MMKLSKYVQADFKTSLCTLTSVIYVDVVWKTNFCQVLVHDYYGWYHRSTCATSRKEGCRASGIRSESPYEHLDPAGSENTMMRE
eukprot:1315785-Amphidinium_carterae.1